MKGPVAVVGLGPLGRWVAGGLKARPEPPMVFGVDPDPLRGSSAREAGAVDQWDPSGEASLSEARIVVYATSFPDTLRLLGEQVAHLHSEAWVTDVLELKSPVLRRAAQVGIADRFVGAHPVPKEGSGGSHASLGDGLAGAQVWLCADSSVSPLLRKEAQEFWVTLGGTTEWTDAQDHDHQMAWLSHLPQLVSNALAGAIHAAGYSHASLDAAGKGMTAPAGSPPEHWVPLLETAAPAVGAGLTSVSRALNMVADLLARREVDRIGEFMERTRGWVQEGAQEGEAAE